MAARKPKDKDKDAVALQSQVPVVFGISQELLQATINTLAELPYKTVGSLVNQLRSCTPAISEAPKEDA